MVVPYGTLDGGLRKSLKDKDYIVILNFQLGHSVCHEIVLNTLHTFNFVQVISVAFTDYMDSSFVITSQHSLFAIARFSSCEKLRELNKKLYVCIVLACSTLY